MPNPTTPEAAWPVRTVARKIAEWVGRLGEVWVEGEVAQVSRRRGARIVFLVLRDPSADMSISVTCPPEVLAGTQISDGTRVVCRARPEFYAGRGILSLRAAELRPVGVGALLARLEALKRLLASEGLLAAERKRPLPFLPGCIGLVTGRASAAERDVVETATARWPAVRFRIENVAVQGAGAAAGVIAALRRLDADRDVAVIVLARGGGSVQDLLPWSDEALCRAVAAAATPVVSAIGHEPDTPLVDLVADVRALTPTDAGKRIVPAYAEELAALARRRAQARAAVRARVGTERDRLDALRARARRCATERLDRAAADLMHTRARARALSPHATLARGYAVVHRVDRTVLRRAADAESGESLSIRLAEGTLSATATGSTP
ncbi:MAG: exodeoxyribonuclease VII large subunit [Mycobacteriales bacterium]|nr:MAG: exodeoxyribonuclease VII large subunit [Pseudonocardiales bacterium]